MRDGYSGFTDREAEILAVGPDTLEAYIGYWRENSIPYPGLPDPGKTVLKLYKQEINLFKLGRMPMNAVVDRTGTLRYVHYGYSMADIPDNETLWEVIDALNGASI